VKLWVDDREDAPNGWRRARNQAEVETALRGGRVVEVSLGGSDLLVDLTAQSLEQGAFTARFRPLKVVLRSQHPVAARALENAARHWAAAPAQVPRKKPAAGNVLVRFVIWHLLGFVLALCAVETWCWLRHGTHAPIIQRFLPR